MIKFHKAKANNKEQDWFKPVKEQDWLRPVSGTVLFSITGTFFRDFLPEINKNFSVFS